MYKFNFYVENKNCRFYFAFFSNYFQSLAISQILMSVSEKLHPNISDYHFYLENV